MRFFIIIIFFYNIFFTLNSQDLTDFVLIKGGKFKMGSKLKEDEQPVRKILISDFYILDHEVTNEEYAHFLNQKGNFSSMHYTWIELNGFWREQSCKIYEKDGKFYVEEGFEDYPVIFVSWWGANAYAEWLGGRLPTEAEWEYIAQQSLSEIGDKENILQYEVLKENSYFMYSKVKSKKPLPNGLYDFFGNLSEWCYDWYSPKYDKKANKHNPKGPEKGDQKVKRGYYWGDPFSEVNSTDRKASNPNNNNITVGFRVVKPVE